MGFIFKAIKRELLSLVTIFLVFIPLLNHSNLLPSSGAVANAAKSFVVQGPAADLKGMMQGIGQLEAMEVEKVLGIGGGGGSSLVVGHAPIFLTETTY